MLLLLYLQPETALVIIIMMVAWAYYSNAKLNRTYIPYRPRDTRTHTQTRAHTHTHTSIMGKTLY